MSSVRQLKFNSNQLFHVQYKLKHDGSFCDVSVASKPSLRKGKKSGPSSASISLALPSVPTCIESKKCLLPFDKIVHLKKLSKFMPLIDSQFVSNFFKQYNDPKIFAAELSRLTKKSKTCNNIMDVEMPSTYIFI